MSLVDAACRESGVSATFYTSAEFAHPKPTDDASRYQLVFVLNLDAPDVPALTDRLKQYRTQNPAQRVLSLDARDSQADIDHAGLMTHDDAIPHYWRPNGSLNLQRMIRYCLVKYLSAPGQIEAAVMIPDFGYYDPEHEDSFPDIDQYKQFKTGRGRWKGGAPTAVLIIQQSFWITHDLKVVDAEIRALEHQGLNVVVVFGDRENQVASLIRSAKPTILIEDRHGGMWESNALLKELNVPYLRPISMLASTVDEWKANPHGLTTRDVGLFMSLQEFWGTLEPIVVGGLVANYQGFRLHEPIPDRIDDFAARAARWASLRQKANSEKKVAIIYYNKGLGQDDLMRGSPTGGFLDAPESLIRFLPAMKEAGYKLTTFPTHSKDLIAAMLKGGRNIGPWAQGDLEKMVDESSPILIPLSTYKKWFDEKLSEPDKKAIIDKFGPPPGRIMVVTRNGEPQIVLPRIDLGNVILTPQPERGEKQDEALLHSRDVPPPHNYLAFYWWLDEQFKADAIVHWGTHGSLELLPGKEAGLSGDDWSDICAGHLPIIDLWITDNLGEVTLARRRSYAEIVDHTVPPAVTAGLNDQYKPLHEDIHKYRNLDIGLVKETFRKRITSEAHDAKLDDLPQLGNAGPLLSDDAISRLDVYLHCLYESMTPTSLHILGQPPAESVMAPYLVSILGQPFLDHLAAANISDKLTFDNKQDQRAAATSWLEAALQDHPPTSYRPSPDLAKDLAFARDMRARLQQSGDEITNLIRALNAEYIETGPGPDPIRNPASVPTGKNLYALNPEEIPTRSSWEVACKLVDELLRKRQPKKIAMDLNGMDTMRDFGVMEGQILDLLGVRPIWNRNNLVIDVELIPAAELKRPRVDVFIAMGGQYKENFPSRVTLLDKAVRLAASAPEAVNPVRDGVAAMRAGLLSKGFSTERAEQFAAARIFGTKPGNMSGTNILYLVPRSGVWDKDDDITSVYMDNMSYVYTGGMWGEKVDGLYEQALQGTDTILRVWASNMTSQLSNHHAYEYLGGLSMAVKKVTGTSPHAYIADVRDPGGARVRDFEEVLATNLHSELLNPKWIQGLQQHDYAGAGHISELVKNTFGWSVTRPESVSQQAWGEIYDVYIKDSDHLGLSDWFERVSPHALQEIAATMLEASRKGIWNASPEQVATLSRLYAASVAKHGDSGGLVSGGNTRLTDYITGALTSAHAPGDQQLAQAMKTSEQKTAATSAGDKVTGQKLDQVSPTPQPSQQPTPQTHPAPNPVPLIQTILSWQVLSLGIIGLLVIFGFFRKSGAL
jgi:cobaltochelatase CobN